MSAKAKGVAKCGTHLALLCLVEREVEVIINVFVHVVVFVVDGWGYDVVLNG